MRFNRLKDKICEFQQLLVVGKGTAKILKKQQQQKKRHDHSSRVLSHRYCIILDINKVEHLEFYFIYFYQFQLTENFCVCFLMNLFKTFQTNLRAATLIGHTVLAPPKFAPDFGSNSLQMDTETIRKKIPSQLTDVLTFDSETFR